MMRKTLLLSGFILLAVIYWGCRNDNILPEEIPDPNGSQVEFSADILPIFTENCAGCHVAGKQPDLTADNAFASLNNSEYVNLDAPDQSLIYLIPNPDNTGEHTQKKYTEKQAAQILIWIQQGAENN